MKSFLFTIFLAISAQAAQNSFNEDCKFAYREASVKLLDEVEEFNSHANRSQEVKSRALEAFIVKTAGIDSVLGAKRAVCHFAETAENRECVEAYKGLYQDLRGRINLIAMASGNQDDVDLSFISSIGILIKVGAYDVKCGYLN